MDSIHFVDAWARRVELHRPMYKWELYQIRINDVCVGTIEKDEGGQWSGRSRLLDSMDLAVLSDIVTDHENQKKRSSG